MLDQKSLKGKRIVVTRAREQAEELSEKLGALGATAIAYPMIEIVPPHDFAPLDRAIQQIMQYDWVVFSSANGVRSFGQRQVLCQAHDRTSHRLDDCLMRQPRMAAIGEKTAQALRQSGWRVDAVPDEYLTSQIADTLGAVRDKRILLVRPEVAPGELSDLLRERGAEVDEVVAYRTVPVRQPQQLSLDEVDAITLASASAASNFAAQLSARTIPARVCVACIGPATAKAARAAGLRVDAVARPHTSDGLVQSLLDYFNPLEARP